MAAFSITSCASWRRNGSDMIVIRPALLSAAAMLLASCAPDGDGGGDRDGHPDPFHGFELAKAKGANPHADVSTLSRHGSQTVRNVSPAELRERLSRGNVRLIDVRTDAEVAEGVIPGAEQIALDEFDPVTIDRNDGREIVLYCRSGRRSRIAGERLADHTGQPARHLDGGVIAWTQAGGELDTRPD